MTSSGDSAAGRPRMAGLALFSVPFRPFFLLAGGFAATAVPLWLLVRAGQAAQPGQLAGSLWHGHEMVFGFALAVFAGFLLTAAQNWTGRPTASGLPLAALALLWLAGRVLLLLPATPHPWLAIVVDGLFLPAMAVLLLRPILLAGNRRNLLFPIAVLALAGLNVAIHLAALGRVDWDPSRLLQVALDLIALMMVIMGGRVIPAFTGNALPGAGVATWRPVDVAAIALTAAIVPVDLLGANGLLLGIVAAAAALANGLRMLPWRGWVSWRQPIVAVLHLAFLWLPIAFLLRAGAAFDWLPPDAALHALGSGAIGLLTLAMMSRVALGHSGRKIIAAPLTVLAYGLILASGLLRVFAATGTGSELWLNLAGVAWTLGWLGFLVVYAPICAGSTDRPGHS